MFLKIKKLLQNWKGVWSERSKSTTFFKSILSSGVQEATSLHDSYRIRSINSFCLFCLIVSFPYYFIFSIHGLIAAFWLIFVAHLGFISTVVCNAKKKFLLGKFILILTTNASVLFISLMFGVRSGFHLYIYTSPLFVFWLFGSNQGKTITYTFFLYVGLMLLVFYHDTYFDPIYRFDFDVWGINMYILNALLNLVLVFLLFHNYFRYQILLTNDLLDKQKRLELEVSKRRESEAHIKRLFDDLTLSYKNLEQFSYVVSHNMRSPVANIKGFVGLYQKQDDENSKLVGYVEQAACHLDNILSDLNYILKCKNTALENKEQISLEAFFDHLEMVLSHEIDSSGTIIKRDFGKMDSLWTIKSAFTSIVYNLIQNAIKYKKNWESPLIVVSFSIQDGYYLLKISDNGIGIDLEKYRERVFKLYSRLHRNIDGKGIGLYLVKTHVEMLGGTIEIESRVNHGTSFLIKLPLNR